MNMGSILASSINQINAKPNLEVQLQNQENIKIQMDNMQRKRTDLQDLGNVTDTCMMSEEAKKQMNLISGTGGNDTITASVNKENGAITININGQERTYTAEEAANGFRVELGDGNDSVDLSAIYTSVLMDAGEGDNNITLGQGRNVVTAGDGNNIINSSGAHRNSITTGNGNNTIDVTGDINTIKTGSGTDSISVTGNDSYVDAGAGKDTITGMGDRNRLHGGDGDDVIISSGKKDDIYGENGNDTIVAGNGSNYIEGGKGDDKITAGNGNNVVYGLDGKDTIKVGNGKNYIDGGKGDDNITTGTGRNIIAGGKGKDTIDATKSSEGTILDDDQGKINASEKMKVKTYDVKDNADLGKSIEVTGDDDFKARVESDIETFKHLESGEKLLSELDKSGHKVTIEKFNDQNGRATPLGDDTSKAFVTPDGKRGEGTDVKVEYNPAFKGTEDYAPIGVLFHEGVHAYNNATGTTQPGEQAREHLNDVNKREHQAVGLEVKDGIPVEHPDGTVSASNPKGLTENAIREEMGFDKREVY